MLHYVKCRGVQWWKREKPKLFWLKLKIENFKAVIKQGNSNYSFVMDEKLHKFGEV